MRRIAILIGLAAGLASCASNPDRQTLPPVTVAGPVFPASQFEPAALPVPPDPQDVPPPGGKAAARYEGQLRTSVRVCYARLGSVGRQLDAAGLVVRLKQGAQQ